MSDRSLSSRLTLYGHLDRELALERVQRAYEGMANVHPLRAVDERDAR